MLALDTLHFAVTQAVLLLPLAGTFIWPGDVESIIWANAGHEIFLPRLSDSNHAL